VLTTEEAAEVLAAGSYARRHRGPGYRTWPASIAARPLQVEILDETTSRLVEMLFEGEVNAAIAGDATELSERVDRWVLFEERLLILMSQRNPLAKFAAIPADELVGVTWLERVGCEFVEAVWDARLPETHGRKIVHRGRHESHLQHMVSAGLGIVLLTAEHMPRLPSVVARGSRVIRCDG
jgi:DNA-binding transcriptional LysR family regulator